MARNAVRRRLRGVVVSQQSSLPTGTDLVVRALPAAVLARFDVLATDFSDALLRVSARIGPGDGSR